MPDLTKPPSPEELTQLHIYIENILIDFRDAGLAELCANGLVVRHYNGKPSPVIRIGTRNAVDLIIKKFIEMRMGN